MEQLVVGADFGTEGVRVRLFDLSGGLKGYATEPYWTVHPGPAAAEQDPQQWWSAFILAMGALVSDSGASPDQVVGVGLDATLSRGAGGAVGVQEIAEVPVVPVTSQPPLLSSTT
ncbi:MAG: hypothetical protein H0W21_04860 [Actinobacteria bacterium]|nr:hypothetical protein [Actinomycetota bacterium]